MGEVLDFVGGEEELGKPTGQDLREGACDACKHFSDLMRRTYHDLVA